MVVPLGARLDVHARRPRGVAGGRDRRDRRSACLSQGNAAGQLRNFPRNHHWGDDRSLRTAPQFPRWGLGLAAFGVLLWFLMEEKGFSPTPAAERETLAQAKTVYVSVLRQVKASRGLLMLMFAAIVFGAFSEGYDRLAGALLVRELGFGPFYDVPVVVWWAALAAVSSLTTIRARVLGRTSARRPLPRHSGKGPDRSCTRDCGRRNVPRAHRPPVDRACALHLPARAAGAGRTAGNCLDQSADRLTLTRNRHLDARPGRRAGSDRCGPDRGLGRVALWTRARDCDGGSRAGSGGLAVSAGGRQCPGAASSRPAPRPTDRIVRGCAGATVPRPVRCPQCSSGCPSAGKAAGHLPGMPPSHPERRYRAN